MQRLPPLNALRVFRHAAENLSFKETAEQLHVTQAAVSQQIRLLESQLDRQLFRRLNREVSLTPDGQQLLPFVQRGFNALEEGIASLQQDPDPNLLTISALPSFASRWLMPNLGDFQRQYPQLNIRISPTLGLDDFTDSGTDLAIRYGQGEYPGLQSRLLLEDHLLPVCHPGLLDERRPLKEQLRDLPVLIDDGPDLDRAWQEFLSELQLPSDGRRAPLGVSDSGLLVEAVLCGQGLSMLRFSLAYQLLERGQLVCPLHWHFESPYRFYLVAPERHFERPKVRRFEHWIRDGVAEIEASWQRFISKNPGHHRE